MTDGEKTEGGSPADLFAAGVACQRRGDLAGALRFYGASLMGDGEQPDAYNNMGVALRALKRFEAAAAAYRRSLALRPDNAGTWSNLGNVLRDLGRYGESAAAHRQAVQGDPKGTEPLYNLGLVLRDMGLMDDALACFDKVLDRRRDHHECRWDRALTLLYMGRYGEGFREYESRWQLRRSPPRDLGRPRWDGAPLDGRTLLVHQEQGFGDMIQFARYLPLVHGRFGGPVVVECQPELVRLFASLPGVDRVVARGAPLPAFDLAVPLLALPGLFGTTLETVPDSVPYLAPPAGQAARLAAPPQTRLKIGIVWAGKLVPRDRSCPLERFIGLMDIPGTAFYSLQRDERVGDLGRLACEGLVSEVGTRVRDFADTASVLNALDLVITIDSAVAHLAGALGRPVWTLLLHSSDWRWLDNGRDGSPWYPTMRLYRQPQPGDWDAVFVKVRHDLEEASRNTLPADSAN